MFSDTRATHKRVGSWKADHVTNCSFNTPAGVFLLELLNVQIAVRAYRDKKINKTYLCALIDVPILI